LRASGRWGCFRRVGAKMKIEKTGQLTIVSHGGNEVRIVGVIAVSAFSVAGWYGYSRPERASALVLLVFAGIALAGLWVILATPSTHIEIDADGRDMKVMHKAWTSKREAILPFSDISNLCLQEQIPGEGRSSWSILVEMRNGQSHALFKDYGCSRDVMQNTLQTLKMAMI
jgi:hypothetical protein